MLQEAAVRRCGGGDGGGEGERKGEKGVVVGRGGVRCQAAMM